MLDERIRAHGFTEHRLREVIQISLELSKRELTDSTVEALSLDGRYEHAYAAMSALAEVVMLAEGFRPSGGVGQHHVLFDFLRLVPTAQWRAEAEYFDACRQRRHTVAYRQPHEVTATELTELIQEAAALRRLCVPGWLNTIPDW